VIIDDDVLEQVDAVVGERGRSRFLQQAAIEKLERLELEQALRETAGALGPRGAWADRDATAEWVRATRAAEDSG
jgi:hypothetical protein